jgi:hypothetical protein
MLSKLGWRKPSQHKQRRRHRYKWTPRRYALMLLSRLIIALTSFHAYLLMKEGKR